MPASQTEPTFQHTAFVGSSAGAWAVTSIAAVCGVPLDPAPRLKVVQGAPPPDHAWVLRGVASNLRYTTAHEARLLRAKQEPLGRAEARRAALIPIRKTAAWWALAQDERRSIIEETSKHTSIGLEYLPRIARKLFHGRDLGEPFDFLTWFEFAPEHQSAFDELVARLRASEEWRHVDREVDVRLNRVD